MKIALCFALVLCLFPSMGHAGVEGKYAIDTKRLVREMSAAIKKLSAKRRAFARMALAMAKSMKSQIVLKKRGKVGYTMSMKVFGKLHNKVGNGFWKQKKTGIHIEIKSQDKKKGKEITDILFCTTTKTGLACKHAKKSGKKTLYYNKVK